MGSSAAVARIAGRGSTGDRYERALRGLAVASNGGDVRVYAVGDAEVKVFDADGALVRRFPTASPGFSVAVDDDGRVWVGYDGSVERFEPDGVSAGTWRDSGRLGRVTAIGFGGDDVFLADATARCVRRYDREGRFSNDIGAHHRKGGFHIPNGVVDFAVDASGDVVVANPGMHRVERYRPDGTPLGHFGRFDGQDPAGFPGCCNPTNLTLDAGGNVIVTEKAGPRVKAYDADGHLMAVLADDLFDPSAKNMDVAVDSDGRVYVADTARLEIVVLAGPTVEGAP